MDTDQGQATARTRARTRATAKYRGLSTSAAKAPPSVEMTFFLGRSKKRTGNGKNKGKNNSNGKNNRRSFDFVARKCASNFAQDDSFIVSGRVGLVLSTVPPLVGSNGI